MPRKSKSKRNGRAVATPKSRAFDDESIVSAGAAIFNPVPTDAEKRLARHIATNIFGGTDDDAATVSHFRQALAIVRMRKAAGMFGDGEIWVEHLVGTLEPCALVILAEHGVTEQPFRLPDGCHPIAGDALAILNCTQNVVTFLRMPDFDVVRSRLVQMGFALNRLCDNVDLRWYMPDLQRGQKIKASARRGHVATHGDALAKEKRWQEYAHRHQTMAAEKPEFTKDGIDAVVAKEFRVHPKTIQRARLRLTKKQS